MRERARACCFPDCYEICGNHAQQNQQVGNLVPPPLATAIGRELLAAATIDIDTTVTSASNSNWVQRAVKGMAARSHWGVWAWTQRAIAHGHARRGVRYTAKENESLVSIARKFGFAHPAPLLALNTPIYPELRSCYQKFRNTHSLKVVLLLPTEAFARDSIRQALEAGRYIHEAADNQTPQEIAQLYGVTVEALLNGNPQISRPGASARPDSRLIEGTQIHLPIGACAIAANSSVVDTTTTTTTTTTE